MTTAMRNPTLRNVLLAAAAGAIAGAVQGGAAAAGVWWLAWVAWGVQFAAIETYALILSARARRAGLADPRDTLSEHVWAWGGINIDGYGLDHNVSGWARFRRVLTGGFLLWLVVHIMAGGAWA